MTTKNALKIRIHYLKLIHQFLTLAYGYRNGFGLRRRVGPLVAAERGRVG